MNKFISRLTALILMLVISCVSVPKLSAAEFNYYQMDLRNYVSSRILPLESFGGNLSSSQTSSIMKNGFLTSGAESYGYFKVTLSNQYIGEGKNSGWWIPIATIATIVTAGILYPVVPIGKFLYQLDATIEFFDCNKKQISQYTSSSMFEGLVKAIKDDYTFKTQTIYQNLLRDCLIAASKDSNKINTALINAKLCDKIPVNARVAVIGANQNTDVTLGSRQIETQLVNSGKFRVLDRVSIDKLIAEINFSRSVYVSEAIEVGKLLSATHIVYVEVAGEGANRKLNFRVLSVRTGEVIASFASSFT